MNYGYGRVSTMKQFKFGYSMEVQKNMLKESGADKIYLDVCTGSTKERPEFKKLMKRLQPGDSLTICRLDRLARSTEDGLDIMRTLKEKEVKLIILEGFGNIPNDYFGELIFTFMMGIAQFEKHLVLERMNEGREYARKTNPEYRDGRTPKYNRKQLLHALELLKTNTYEEVTELTGISKSTLIRAKRKEKAKEIEKQME